jgi:hypothetical protein
MWALMAKAAVEKRASGADGKARVPGLQADVGKFYMERIMPETAAQGPHRNRRGHHDGAGRGGVLSTAHRPV